MEAAVYLHEAEREEHHWWFVGRRKLFARELCRAGVSHEARVLDVGVGTGANLRLLRDLGFSKVTGLDPSDDAIRHCAEKGFSRVQRGDVCSMPFADGSFDLVLATDVIEHVDDDDRAVAEIMRVLDPAGLALITVPAFQSLWGLQDRQSLHKRRYRLRPLVRLLRSHGLRVQRYYYFNYLMFVPVWLVRRLIDLLGLRLESESQINSPFINRTMSTLFAFDLRTAPVMRFPFGVSILAIAKR
jgi:SAM-dependent methyltransferase